MSYWVPNTAGELPADGGGAGPYANIIDYGGTPVVGFNRDDGLPPDVFDNKNALQDAITSGLPVWVPAGLWAISTLAMTDATMPSTGLVRIEGPGTFIPIDPSSGDDIMTFTSAANTMRVVLKDLSLVTWETVSSTVNHPTVRFVGCKNVHCENVKWSYDDPTQLNGASCSVSGTYGVVPTVYGDACRATFIGCHFDMMAQLFIVNAQNVSVIGCVIDGYLTPGVHEDNNTYDSVDGILISGCIFDSRYGKNSPTLIIVGGPTLVTGVTVVGNIFRPRVPDEFSTPQVLQIGLSWTGATNGPVLIASNLFHNPGVSESVQIVAGSTNFRVTGNLGAADRP